MQTSTALSRGLRDDLRAGVVVGDVEREDARRHVVHDAKAAREKEHLHEAHDEQREEAEKKRPPDFRKERGPAVPSQITDPARAGMAG